MTHAQHARLIPADIDAGQSGICPAGACARKFINVFYIRHILIRQMR